MVFTETEHLNKLKGEKQDLIDFATQYTYDTQAIEGSTVSLEETKTICRDNYDCPNANPDFVKETRNHYELLMKLWHQKEDISMSMIHKWHYEQFKDTKKHIAGLPRTVDVGIFGTRIRFPEWKDVPYHLLEFFHWYDRVKKGIHPVYLAAFAHLKFVNIHPYEDGNGRTSRLVMNYILHRNGFPMLNIPLECRRQYFEALNMAREYDHWDFVKFISQLMLQIPKD